MYPSLADKTTKKSWAAALLGATSSCRGGSLSPAAMATPGDSHGPACAGKEMSLTFCRASWYCGSEESWDSEWYGDNPFLRVRRSPVLDCCKNNRKQEMLTGGKKAGPLLMSWLFP